MPPSTIERLAVDAAAAGCAALTVAPIIATIDKGIMEHASGRNQLSDSIRMSVKKLIFTPHKFIFSKAFGLVFLVYSSTYGVANLLDTASSIAKKEADIKKTTAGTAKFLAASTANISVGLIKDRKFTQMFGTAKKASPLPPATYALFCARDCMTILFSFNIPPRIAKYFPESPHLPGPSSVAQFLAPASCQFLSTPLHLLGLDLYNRPKLSFRERWDILKQNYFTTASARIRIVPAFGFGGVVNNKARRRYLTWLESKGGDYAVTSIS